MKLFGLQAETLQGPNRRTHCGTHLLETIMSIAKLGYVPIRKF